jgi:CheY-like chemotaxis protein/HPt (histidine-containing phosphotransfer) domain-containing protein
MDNETDPSLLRRIGFAGSLNKPIRPSQLFDALVAATAHHVPEAAEVAEVLSETHGPSEAAPAGRRLRILVAEDNRVNQVVIAEMLSRMGHACDIVDDGLKAVRALQEPGYDLAFMDCQMPEMDGFEATRAIRRRERERPQGGGRVPIFALTANAVKGDREQCLEAGMDGYLSKPINQARLREVVESHSNRQPPSPPSGGEAPAAIPAVASDGPDGTVLHRPADAAPEDDTPPLDLDVLLERCMGSVDTVRLILDEFKKQAVGDLDRIEQSLGGGDRERLRGAAHSLKGAAGMMSAQAVCAAAARIEDAARAGALDNGGAMLERLQADVHRCLAYLPVIERGLAQREAASAATTPTVSADAGAGNS